MMPFADPAYWSEYLRQTLRHYGEPLLRQVAARLFKPRSQWPAEDVIERCLATLNNAAVVDRRLLELDLPARRLLACIGHSRQPRWQLGHLLELLAVFGCAEGPQAVLRIFAAGLLYPDLLAGSKENGVVPPAPLAAALGSKESNSPSPAAPCALPSGHCPLNNFEQWLGQGSAGGFAVFAHPLVTARALGTDLGLPVCACGSAVPPGTVHEADGLEWPLRLAALWQLANATPLRRTQQGGFFKRDLDRLRADPLLNAPPADIRIALPDAALLAVSLAQNEGLLVADRDKLCPGSLPLVWEEGLPSTLASLWGKLFLLKTWNAQEGWCSSPPAGNPYPSAYLLLSLLLARLPADAWADPADLEQWLVEHHPYWSGKERGALDRERGARSTEPGAQSPERERQNVKHGAQGTERGAQSAQDPMRCGPRCPGWVSTFLLGLAYQLRIVQAGKTSSGSWVVRLSPLGRCVLGISAPPGPSVASAQTLLTQPNLEIIVYRQALTPGLIARLSRFATWKSFGSACTLQLQAEAVYRALENGFPFEQMLQTLEQHGTRPTPPAVIDSLRTWADKRERISVYPSATLFEFAKGEDLQEALARGLPGVRLSERMLLVADEQAVDFRHFRLTGTRDYALAPERCLVVAADGVTLAIDAARSDLLLEIELKRFAEPLDSAANGTHHYRLTPASLAASRASGLGLRELDAWFMQRSGQPLSPAARLLLTGPQAPPPALRPQLVLHVATPELAEGLLQWPETRSFIRERLGPTALAVAREDVECLRQRLEEAGVKLIQEDG